MNRQTLARKIIDTCLEMTRLGLNQGTAGNISVRYLWGTDYFCIERKKKIWVEKMRWGFV
ncbi:class II aldolase/adducin family protein [Glaesserella parasuis]|uniref:class II aldolase/adducin family protein n=1 Tax=Glaesserella parasuis TaxID=738 RepID=UPI003AF9FED2